MKGVSLELFLVKSDHAKSDQHARAAMYFRKEKGGDTCSNTDLAVSPEKCGHLDKFYWSQTGSTV